MCVRVGVCVWGGGDVRKVWMCVGGGRRVYLFCGGYVHVLHAQTHEGGERAHVLQDVALGTHTELGQGG